MTGATKFEDLFTTYEMPKEMTDRLEAKFKDLVPPGIALQSIDDRFRFRNSGGERLGRVLAHYCAQELARECDIPEGKGLSEKLLQVMAEEKQGLLLKGVPRDPQTKALINLGMTSLIGTQEDTGNNAIAIPTYFDSPVRKTPDFHRDNNILIDRWPKKNSFMILSSGQKATFKAPTLFKRMGAPDEEHVAHALSSDEILLFNNKTLKHSAGFAEDEDKRRLLRSIINRAGNFFSVRHLVDGQPGQADQLFDEFEVRPTVEQLRAEKVIPQSQEELRHWIIAEASRVKASEEAGVGGPML